MTQDIKLLAEEWLRLDKDPVTRDEIYRLLVSGDHDELENRLRNRIVFGTAGLRATMEAGFSRLNSLTIIQASQGLAAYLLQRDPDVRRKGVVIGRDARHNSEKFAKLTAAAFVEKKIKVWWLEIPTHTPMVPFGVQELNASAGIMITASHNPAKDNGYKVYWSNGSQIIPPHDRGIADSIEKNLEPATWDTSCVDDDSLLVEGALGLVQDAYYSAVRAAALPEGLHEPTEGFSKLRFAYTAMHGVGLRAMATTVAQLGLSKNMAIVQEQAKPDPDFPTVKFPNPEEKGALDLSIKTADNANASLILASDPDADRLAVAEKVDGTWRQYTGNQLGILFAAHIFESHPSSDKSNLSMLSSAVSSRMLASMASHEKFHHTETLTGFKWLGNVAQDLEKQGQDVVFAFEEAIGYMIPSVVYDKDSISAAAVFLTAAAHWSEQGLTPWSKLQQLYKKYGHFEDSNTYLISPSPTTTTAVFKAIRALGTPHPTHLGKRQILRWRDLTEGYDSGTKNHVPALPVDKSSEMITCELSGHVVFTVRGSGTEPKIKLYVEGKASTAKEAKAAADEVVEDLLKEWFPCEKYGLKLA